MEAANTTAAARALPSLRGAAITRHLSRLGAAWEEAAEALQEVRATRHCLRPLQAQSVRVIKAWVLLHQSTGHNR